MRKKWFWIAPLAILAMVAFVVIGGEVVMRLWNWLVPGLFGWQQITFWQAVGLLALCRILFGGVSGRGHHGSNFRGRGGERWGRGRWGRMTAEEREKFRQSVRECWGPVAPPESNPTA